MTIETQHPKFIECTPKWARCRDAFDGQDAVHAKKTEYLPKPSGQTAEEFRSYLMRATFWNASARTLDALRGTIMSKPPTVSGFDNPTLEPLLADIDASGTAIEPFTEQVVSEVLQTGRALVWANHTGDPSEQLTVAEAEAAGRRPYLHVFTAEQVHDWRFATINGVRQLSFVKIFEIVHEPNPVNEWADDAFEQYRVFDLGTGAYRVRLFRRPKSKENLRNAEKWEQFGPDEFPQMNGAPMPSIPAQLIDTGKVPMLDLVDLNLSHYRTMADLEHGCHFTGLPTPYIAGGVQGDDDAAIPLGSTSILQLDKEGTAGYMAFGADGLASLENLRQWKEQGMALLGGRLLSPERGQVESADGQAIRRNGENSALSRIAQLVSAAMTNALAHVVEWTGADASDVALRLSREFNPTVLDAPQIAALLAAVQGGQMSPEAFTWNLKRAGMIEDETTVDDERDRIADTPPALGTIVA